MAGPSDQWLSGIDPSWLQPAPGPPAQTGPGPSAAWLSQGEPVLTQQGVQAAPSLPAGTSVPMQQAAPLPQMVVVPQPAPAPSPGAGPVATPAGGPPAQPVAVAAPPAVVPSPDGLPPSPFGTPQMVSGGGVTPAHEVVTRGPKQEELLERSFKPQAEAAGRANERNQGAVVDEHLLYQQEAERAQHRADAAEAQAAKRSQEMQAQLGEYNAAIDRAASMKVDSSRWWGNKSTGDKIGTTALAFLGGLFGGQSGGAIGKSISDQIDADVAAQKFDYESGLQHAKGKETVYKMMLEKYGSEDAAVASTRAAALDATQMRIKGLGASWKGVESQNKSEELQAALEAESLKTKAAGFKYVQAQSAGRRFTIPGMPGTFSEKEAQAYAIKTEVEPVLRAAQTKVEGDVAAQTAAAKGDPKAKSDLEERYVPTSSTGKGYYARTKEEAVKHREQQASGQGAIDTIDKMDTLSNRLGWTGRLATGLPGVPQTKDAKELDTYGKVLVGQVNQLYKFGALDKGTQELIDEMIGNPSSVLGNHAKLSALKQGILEGRRGLEKSATGEKPSTVPEGTVGGAQKQAW